MSGARISIIVPAHNSRQTLRECLGAICDSGYGDYELIVVDDKSSDDSAQIAAEFPCRLIVLDENMGSAAARNRGAHEAKGDILLFVDSDIKVRPDSVSRIAGRLLEDSSLAGVSGVYALHNRHGNFFSQYKHLVACYRDRITEDVNQNSFRGAFFAVRKDVFIRVKFRESSKGASIEDIEFGRELISLGYKFALDKGIEVEHDRRYTLRSFFRNQFLRSRDILGLFLRREPLAFYMGKKRKNPYAKMYFLRVPLSAAVLLAICSFLVTGYKLYLYFLLFLILLPVILEYGFLKFCFEQRGAAFAMGCVFAYFMDGFIGGLGIISGLPKLLKGGAR